MVRIVGIVLPVVVAAAAVVWKMVWEVGRMLVWIEAAVDAQQNNEREFGIVESLPVYLREKAATFQLHSV